MLLFHYPTMYPVVSPTHPTRYLSPKSLDAAVETLTLGHGFFPATTHRAGIWRISFSDPSRDPAKAVDYLLVDPSRADMNAALIVRSVPFALASDPRAPTLRQVADELADALQEIFDLHASSPIRLHTPDARRPGAKREHTLLWSPRWTPSHVAIQLSSPERGVRRVDVVVNADAGPSATSTRVMWALFDLASELPEKLMQAAKQFFWTERLAEVVAEHTPVSEPG